MKVATLGEPDQLWEQFGHSYTGTCKSMLLSCALRVLIREPHLKTSQQQPTVALVSCVDTNANKWKQWHCVSWIHFEDHITTQIDANQCCSAVVSMVWSETHIWKTSSQLPTITKVSVCAKAHKWKHKIGRPDHLSEWLYTHIDTNQCFSALFSMVWSENHIWKLPPVAYSSSTGKHTNVNKWK